MRRKRHAWHDVGLRCSNKRMNITAPALPSPMILSLLWLFASQQPTRSATTSPIHSYTCVLVPSPNSNNSSGKEDPISLSPASSVDRSVPWPMQVRILYLGLYVYTHTFPDGERKEHSTSVPCRSDKVAKTVWVVVVPHVLHRSAYFANRHI